MSGRIKVAVSYFLFWIIYFMTGRVIFLAYQKQQTALLEWGDIGGVFLHGLKMDFSAAGYICGFFFLVLSISGLLSRQVTRKILFYYTVVVLVFTSLLSIIDLEIFNAWGFRIDSTPLRYLANPGEAWASSKSSPVLLLAVLFILLFCVSFWVVKRFIFRQIDKWGEIRFFPFVVYGLLMSGLLIIPIRGGFGLAPMNQSAVYFSKNNFANISAINPVWNFIASVMRSKSGSKNPYIFLQEAQAKQIVKDLYESKDTQRFVLDSASPRPNILIIVWESFTKKAEGLVYKGVPVTPRFEELKKEGIYFDSLYAVGDRTDKGLPGILSGYPTQPEESIIKHPEKTDSLFILSKDFKKQGYTTSFYYGGEANFANIKSYLFAGQFDTIVEMSAYPAKLATSKWGVHDEYTFNKFIEDFKTPRKQPFFSTFLTLSSHEPFETTTAVAIPGEDIQDKYLNSLHYTDEMLGRFIATAKQQPWWHNTLIVIIADHGHRLPDTGNKIDNFKIPMLWLGGVVKTPMAHTHIGSQMDLPATLLGQLKMDYSTYIWSKNLFSPYKNWAFFTFNNGFGYITPQAQILYDNTGKQLISSTLTNPTKELTEGKALEQLTYQDFLKR
ncbi:MAG: LTA synthase family protein [Niabella sp.]